MISITLNGPESAPSEILEATADFLKKLAKINAVGRGAGWKADLCESGKEDSNDTGNSDTETRAEIGPDITEEEAVEKYKEVMNTEKKAPPPPGARSTAVAKLSTNVREDTKGFSPKSEIEYDSRGFSWDERIHAETKTKNADQSWRMKRNVDKKLVEEIEAEQRNDAEKDFDKTHDLAPKTIKKAPAPPTSKKTATDTFITLMKRISQANLSGILTSEQVSKVCLEIVGSADVSKLARQTEYIPAVAEAIDQLIAEAE